MQQPEEKRWRRWWDTYYRGKVRFRFEGAVRAPAVVYLVEGKRAEIDSEMMADGSLFAWPKKVTEWILKDGSHQPMSDGDRHVLVNDLRSLFSQLGYQTDA